VGDVSVELDMQKTDPNFLRIYAVLPRTLALGPFLRFAVWVQGCNRECPWCMTPDARPCDQGTVADTGSLARQIIADSCIKGMTISGGEPFLQPGALSRLIDSVRRERDMGVIVYTGFMLEELRLSKDQNIRGLLDRTDLLIDGPYIRELDDGLSLRGSSNQNICLMTGRYAKVAGKYYGQSRRKVELHLLKNEIFLAGIPGPEMLEKWKEKQLV